MAVNGVPASPSSTAVNGDGFLVRRVMFEELIIVRGVFIIGHNLRVAQLPQFH